MKRIIFIVLLSVLVNKTGICQNDSIFIKSIPDTPALKMNSQALAANKMDTLKPRSHFSIAFGTAFNPIPRSLDFPHYAFGNKNENAFIDFKVIPQVNLIYFGKKHLSYSLETWYSDGSNLLQNVGDGNGLTNFHLGLSTTYRFMVKQKGNVKIAPYAGLKYYYSTKNIYYDINNDFIATNKIYTGDTIHYFYDYTESSVLQLFQIPAGICVYGRKVLVDLGCTFNVFGSETGDYQSFTNYIGKPKEYGTYSKSLALFGSMRDKFFLANVTFKIGYLF
ncbi:MAG: hypothetical protein WCL14_04940 [Bacteroidota bacterium]